MKILVLLFGVLLLFNSCERKVSTSLPTQPEPLGGLLAISSIPEEAKIYVDGKTSGLVTPDSLKWLEIKRHNITLKKEYYNDTTLSVNIVADSAQNIIVDFNSNPNMRGTLVCASTPDKAQIFLDDKNTGKLTPATIENLIPGPHKIKYVKNNVRSDSTISIVQSGKHNFVSLVLVDTTYWVDYNQETSGIFPFTYNTIAIDKNNVIWLGSISNGITKFDGTTWTNFRMENSGLSNNYINKIKFGPNGYLWVCTISGLNEFDGINWTVYKNNGNTGLPNNNISDIAFEQDGTPIVATQDGLTEFKSNKWKIIKFDLNLPSSNSNENYFTGIDVDNSGNWWATRLQNGIAYWDGINWHQYFTSSSSIDGGSDSNIYYASVKHSNNKIWFVHFLNSMNSAFVGLSSYSNGKFDKSSYTQFNNVTVHNIKIRNGNEKWVSSSIGLYRFVDYNNRIRYWTGNTSLKTNDVQDIAFDSNGDAWVINFNHGIYHFKLSKL